MIHYNYNFFKKTIFTIIIIGLICCAFLIFRGLNPKSIFVTSTDGTSLFQIKNAKAFEANFGENKNMPDMVFKSGDSEIKITIPYSNAKWEKTTKGLRATSDNVIFDYSIIKNNKQESIGIKEEITLNELLQKYGSFIFPSFFTNLHPQLVDGIWKFYDNNWKEKFYIPKPFMIDANNDRSDDVNIEISTDGKFIKITPNKQWLEDKSRKYPIIIDPSFVTPDTPGTINQMTIPTPEPTQTTVSSVKVRTLDNNIIEIGTEKHSPPKPFIKLNKWDGEVSLKVTIPVEVNEQPLNVNNKLKYESINRDGQNKIDVDIYLKQPETITETDSKGKEHTFTINNDGGVEFDTILYEKPATNKVTFGIETQGLEFYYQPALTQQEIDKGWSMPENVVGSYAVYLADNRSGDYSQMGGKNYMTGKAFHIYRPKVSDANGNWTWGNLNVNTTTNELVITVPQEFLDNAVYPINIDPDFGYTTIGAQQGRIQLLGHTVALPTTSGADTSSIDTLRVYTALAGGGPPGEHLQMAIYDTVGPNLISNSTTTSEAISTTTPDWHIHTYSPKPTLSASTNYYLAWTGLDFQYLTIYADYIAGSHTLYLNTNFGEILPLSPLAFSLNSDYKMSIYASYTAAGGGAATVNTTFQGVILKGIKVNP